MARCSVILFVVAVACSFSCKDKEDPAPVRTFNMGFQSSAPRFDDFNLFIEALKMWVEPGNVADAAMITTEVPWKALLEGTSAEDYVQENYTGLVQYYRSNNLKLWVYIDPANGLNRASDANALVDAGKSIANDDMQKIYKRFVIVMDSMLKPDHLGLALETNLIRDASPSGIYNGIKKASNEVAADLVSRNTAAILSISVQADVAWGSLQGDFQYHGIAKDLADFSFIKEMGISSYPYFGYDDPKDIPGDYYSKLADESKLPVFVSEGGWTSQSIEGPDGVQITGSDTEQADYILKQAEMLNNANASALFSLTFTDIDLDALPPGVDPTIRYFAYLGVVDKHLQPKPAFDSWKKVFAYKKDN